tara:strand:+ start:17753 stop:18340 length:588 start_codon:yes stop_codon:yes gene_type:complete
MSIVVQLTEWTQRTFEPLGMWGLFFLAFIESSFFPIPPDILLVIFTLSTPKLWLLLALVCTVGSVLGGIFGYGIGLAGERVILERFFSHSKIDRVHRLFDRFGAWAVFISGFTPIPYKIFTIAAGVFYIDFKKFVVASILGRGLRYFLLAFLVAQFGSVVMDTIAQHEILIIVISIVLLVGGFFLYKNHKKNSSA